MKTVLFGFFLCLLAITLGASVHATTLQHPTAFSNESMYKASIMWRPDVQDLLRAYYNEERQITPGPGKDYALYWYDPYMKTVVRFYPRHGHGMKH